MTSAYENAMSDKQAENYTQQYPVVIHEEISTPFSTAMNCTHVPENSDHICWNCTIKIIEMAEAAEARADSNAELIETLVSEKAQLEAERDECGKAYAAKACTVTELSRIVSEVVVERDALRRQLEQTQSDLVEALAVIDAINKLNRAKVART